MKAPLLLSSPLSPQDFLNETLYVKLIEYGVFFLKKLYSHCSLSLLLDNTETSDSFDIVFWNIKTKLKQQTSHHTEE